MRTKIELTLELSQQGVSNDVLLTTGRLVNGSSCDGIDMVIRNFKFEPNVYAIMRDFLNTNTFSTVGLSNTVVSPTLGESSYVDPSQYPDDLNMPALEDITYSDDEENVGAEADFTNLETNIIVSPIQTTRVYRDHLVSQIISDLSSAPLTRSMTRMVTDQDGLTQINNDDFHTCMFASFLSQKEPKREEGIDYEEVFAPVARIEAIRLFLAYASFMGFMVYQMDVNSSFLYETIKEEKPDEIFISHDKYVAKILRKFGLIDGKSASTPIDTEKPLLNDPDVCACAYFQVTPKASHLHAVKRIFRYLKGKPHLETVTPSRATKNVIMRNVGV
nr:putative ribonuclease H-like domain-containing protein [Tanacetum cinerariifolium]